MLNWYLSSFATIFFQARRTKNSNFWERHILTVAMATARSPIKVPSENEDLPEKENAPEFDEDTLKGDLCST